MRSQSEIIKQQPQKWCKINFYIRKIFQSLSAFFQRIFQNEKLNFENSILGILCCFYSVEWEKKKLTKLAQICKFRRVSPMPKINLKNSHPRHFWQLSRGTTKEEVLDALGHNSSHVLLVWYGKWCNHNLLAFLYAIQIYTHSIPSSASFESVWLIFMKWNAPKSDLSANNWYG